MNMQMESPYDRSVEALKTETISNQIIAENYYLFKSTLHTPLVSSSLQQAHNLTAEMTAESAGRYAIAPARIRLEVTGTGNETTSNYFIPQAYAELTSRFKWSWWLTLTFKDCTHHESVMKVFNNLIHTLNRDCYGQNYWKDKSKGVYWACAVELQNRGVIHLHVLIGGIPDFVRISKYVYWWKAHVAEQVQIERYEAEKGAEYYMSKSSYAWKRGEVDYSDTLILESRGNRKCAIKAHQEFLQAYVEQARLRYPLVSYRW